MMESLEEMRWVSQLAYREVESKMGYGQDVLRRTPIPHCTFPPILVPEINPLGSHCFSLTTTAIYMQHLGMRSDISHLSSYLNLIEI